MCGFTAIAGNLTKSLIHDCKNNNQLLAHRGPDNSSYWINHKNNVLLCHRRLAIIDTVEASHQPFHSFNNKLSIIFNGEIYNYIEIKKILEKKGYIFSTQSDTEVLLYSYLFWGSDLHRHLNGMWSFVIYDERNIHEPKLFFSRDRTGEKPLYYSHSSTHIEFASELKSIRVGCDFDINSLNQYLSFGYITNGKSIKRNVNKLQPGHFGFYNIKNNQLEIKRYWDSQFFNDQIKIKESELIDKTLSLIEDSVRLRFRSDVPVGIFLSGGLDSSIIVAASSKLNNTEVKTYNVGIKNSSLNESFYANEISRYFNTIHTTLFANDYISRVLTDIQPFIDEPLADSSLLPTFMLTKLCRKHVTVALGGDGGDELFGGYRHYQKSLIFDKISPFLPSNIIRLTNFLTSFLPYGFKGKNLINSISQGVQYHSIYSTTFFDIQHRRKLFKKKILSEIDNLALPELILTSSFLKDRSLLENLMKIDFDHRLPENYLFKVDRASMMNSLEVRLPFLDHRLVEFIQSHYPDSYKCTARNRRIMQKKIGKKYLPKNYNYRRKQGFSIPMNEIVRNFNYDSVFFDTLSNYFSIDYIREIIKQNKLKNNHLHRIYSLIILSYSIKNNA